jgi:putative ABC transport system permease protein
MRPVVVGTVVGLAGAYVVAGALRSLLFGVTAADPASYAVTAVILGSVALAACTLPAARAVRVDPMHSLRDQ